MMKRQLIENAVQRGAKLNIFGLNNSGVNPSEPSMPNGTQMGLRICSGVRKSASVCLRVMLAVVAVASVAQSAFSQSTISQSRLAQSRQAPEGFTEPFKTVIVASPESGVLHTLSVREGDRVAEGDIIGRLDSQVLIASVNAAKEKLLAQGKINGAKAKVDSTGHHLEQMSKLLDREHASNKEVKQARLEHNLAKASLEVAKDELTAFTMNLKQIEAQLERRIVRAPIAGTVLELPRQIGEAITASESQVATIVALDKLRVRYFIATKRAMSLRRGQLIGIYFPETNQQAEATVDFVSPVTDSKSGTVRVELLVENPDQKLRSGLACLLGNVKTARTRAPLRHK